jgi:hypothetical protein
MSRYVDALAEYRRKYIPGGPEVLLQLGDNGAREAFRLYRVDLASGATAPPNLTEVNLASIPQFPPERSSFGSGLEVVVEPFHWNGVEFLVEGIGLEEAVLANWCKEWIDVDETHEPDIHGLIGAIHSMTAPEHRDNGVFFSVDFGSAPVEAVTSLLHLLSSIGAQKVRIGSGWAVNGRGDG